jgi:hypothetical protein
LSDTPHTALPANPPSNRTLNGVNLEKLVAESVDHSRRCAACGRMIWVGYAYTLIRLGPGFSDVERRRAREGNAYNAVRVPVHWACATGEEE